MVEYRSRDTGWQGMAVLVVAGGRRRIEADICGFAGSRAWAFDVDRARSVNDANRVVADIGNAAGRHRRSGGHGELRFGFGSTTRSWTMGPGRRLSTESALRCVRRGSAAPCSLRASFSPIRSLAPFHCEYRYANDAE